MHNFTCTSLLTYEDNRQRINVPHYTVAAT